eukprot:scaffold21382_cov131-Skeletonema_menzelii.AAC.1
MAKVSSINYAHEMKRKKFFIEGRMELRALLHASVGIAHVKLTTVDTMLSTIGPIYCGHTHMPDI